MKRGLCGQCPHFYLDVPDNCFDADIFERKQPYKDKNYTKDGLHLMYPDIICDTKIQHLIRKHVISNSFPNGIFSQILDINYQGGKIIKHIFKHNPFCLASAHNCRSITYKFGTFRE